MDRSASSARRNAVLGWTAVGLLAAFAVGFAISGASLWSAGAAAVAGTVLVPAIVRRDPRAMPPWMLPAVSTLPFLLRPYPPFPTVAGYLAVAAVALMVATYLAAFTAVEMTTRFGIFLVVTTTMAVGTAWAGARGLAHLYFGSPFPGGLAALERDLLVTAVGGVVAGVVFEGYFRERTDGGPGGVPLEEA